MLMAKDLMQTNLIVATTEMLVVDVIDILGEKKITALPVVDSEGNLVGIISEKDILEIAYQIIAGYYDFNKGQTVADMMITDVVTFKSEDNLADICQSFMSRPFRRVPVVEDGKPIGIISRRDIIFKAFAMHDENNQTV